MPIVRKTLAIAVLAAFCGVLGYAVGKWILGKESVGKAGSAAVTLPVSNPQGGEVGKHAASPRAAMPDIANAAEFQAYVREFSRDTGASEEFSQWVALTAFAKKNFQAAFQFARSEKLIGLWSTGAAMVNPEKAVAAIRTLPAAESSAALWELMPALGRLEPQKGLALLQTLPVAAAQDAAFSFFQNWAELSVDAAAQAAERLQNRRFRNRSLSGVFHVWGLQDRQAMMEWAAKQDVSIGRLAFSSCYESAGVRDPEKALALVQEFPKTADWYILAEVSGALVAKGESGWDTILELPYGALRNQVMLRAGDDMARDDPAGAWKMFQTLSPEDQNYFLRLSAGSLAKTAPREIAEMFVGGRLGPEYLSSVMRAWTQSDAPAAVAWTSGHLDGLAKMNSLSEIFRQWVSADAVSAMGALQGLAPGPRAQILPRVIQSWASTAPTDALAWAKSLPALDRTRSVDAVIKGWAAKDPVAAAKILVETPSAGLESSYDVISTALVRTQPDYAVQWAGNLSEEGLRNRAIGKIAEAWGRQDASAAADQLAKMQPGGFQDSAITGFVRAITELDPSTAAGWAGSIQNQNLRKESLNGVMQNWCSKDRGAARNFVNAMAPGLLKEEMQRLVEK